MGFLMRFLENRRACSGEVRTAWSGCWLRWHPWLAAGKLFRPDSRVRGLLSLPHVAHIYSAFLSCLRVSQNRFCFLLIQLQTRQALSVWMGVFCQLSKILSHQPFKRCAVPSSLRPELTFRLLPFPSLLPSLIICIASLCLLDLASVL